MRFEQVIAVNVDNTLGNIIEAMKETHLSEMGRAQLHELVNQFVVVHTAEGKVQMNASEFCTGLCVYCCPMNADHTKAISCFEVWRVLPDGKPDKLRLCDPLGGDDEEVPNTKFVHVDTFELDDILFEELPKYVSRTKSIAARLGNHFGVVYLKGGELVVMNTESLANGNSCGCFQFAKNSDVVEKIEVWRLV